MAYINVVAIQDDYVRVEIGGLEYQANLYDRFAVDVFLGQQLMDSLSIEWTDDFGGYYTRSYVDYLEPNTTYRFEGFARWNGTWYSVGSVTAKTTGSTAPPPPPANLYLDSSTPYSLSISWSSVSTATEYDVYVDGSYEGFTYHPNRTMTITGLSPNTRYQIRVSSYNGSGGEGDYIQRYFWTDIAPDTTNPTVSNVKATATKISGNIFNVTVTWSASDNVGIDYQWAYRSPPNSASYTSIGSDLSGSSRSYTFTTDANGNNFLGGNTYYFRIRAIDYSGNMSSTADGTVSLAIPLGRPANWEWEYTISQGGKFYPQSGNGKTAYLMRASHWNEFTARINLFRDYKGLSSYTFTTATTSTTPTGVRNCINQAINAINPMLSTAQRMTTISAGDKVTAKIFTDLVAKIKLL